MFGHPKVSTGGAGSANVYIVSASLPALRAAQLKSNLLYIVHGAAGSGNVYLWSYDTVAKAVNWQNTISIDGNLFINGSPSKNALDSSNNFYLCQLDAAGTGVHVMKFNSSGTLQWKTKWTDANGAIIYQYEVTSAGVVYFTAVGYDASSNSYTHQVAYTTAGALSAHNKLATATGSSTSFRLDPSNNFWRAMPSTANVLKLSSALAISSQNIWNPTLAWNSCGPLDADNSGNVYLVWSPISNYTRIGKINGTTCLWQLKLNDALGIGVNGILDSSGNLVVVYSTTFGSSRVVNVVTINVTTAAIISSMSIDIGYNATVSTPMVTNDTAGTYVISFTVNTGAAAGVIIITTPDTLTARGTAYIGSAALTFGDWAGSFSSETVMTSSASALVTSASLGANAASTASSSNTITLSVSNGAL